MQYYCPTIIISFKKLLCCTSYIHSFCTWSGPTPETFTRNSPSGWLRDTLVTRWGQHGKENESFHCRGWSTNSVVADKQIQYGTDDHSLESLKCSLAYANKTRKLQLSKSVLKKHFQTTLWHWFYSLDNVKLGAGKSGFCKRMDFAQGRCVSNRATPSSFEPIKHYTKIIYCNHYYAVYTQRPVTKTNDNQYGFQHTALLND